MPCMYASPSMMCQPCGNNLSRAYCSRPYFVGWSQASPHTPTDLHVCQTCRRPLQSALLHPCAAQHMPAPTLTACLGHCADSGPKVSFSFCLAGRSTVQCGGLHLSWVMQNFHCQPKKKTEKGLCYVGTGGPLIECGCDFLVCFGFIALDFISFGGSCKTPLRCLVRPWSTPWRL